MTPIRFAIAAAVLAFAAIPAHAEMKKEWVEYSHDGMKLKGYLAYDDKFFYAAFEFADPHPEAIRAPLGDRDNVPSYTDYGGVILDTRNTGKTAILFLANARGIQYDAVTDDASGENSSPDFFWDSAARITERGWIVEMRIPFSTLRYRNLDPQTWGIILFRNYPRHYRYQLMSAKIPRGNNCLICRENLLSGLEGLPKGGHLIAAPYVSATHTARAADDGLSRLSAALAYFAKGTWSCGSAPRRRAIASTWS